MSFKKSLSILKQGEKKAKEEKHETDLMKIYSMMGITYTLAGKADSGIIYQLMALDYFKKNKNKKDEAISLLRMGLAYAISNNIPKTEYYCEQAHDLFMSLGDYVSAINARMGIVNIYFRTFQLVKCLKLLNKVEPEAAKYGLSETIAFSFIYKAGIFSLLQDSTMTAKYQKLAEDYCKDLNLTSFNRMNMIIKGLLLSASLSGDKDSLINKSLILIKKEIPANMIDVSFQTIALS